MIDLRSDTVTRPTREMRVAMADAEVGDDIYGEDPTCRALEERVADLLGKESAVFTVSGTLANLLGVRVLVPPGSELLCESTAHVARAEHGSHAVVSGVTFRTWHGDRGRIDLDAISGLSAPDAGPHLVSTAAVSVENTHNFGGGTVQPYESVRKLREFTREAGIGLHLDGARLWNASAASGIGVDVLAGMFDTVSVCLSKGLGAPVGSLVAGPADLMAEARSWRRRLGAGWRQAGVLAAAGLHALDQHRGRLEQDHANARMLAAELHDVAPSLVDPALVETNIVVLDLRGTGHTATRIAELAGAAGVAVSALGPYTLRLVTHLDVSTADCERAAEVLRGILG